MGVFKDFKLDYGFEEIGTGGKTYSGKENKRLFEEVVLTSPDNYDMRTVYLDRIVSDSVRRQDGTFTQKMDKAIKDGADPTVGLKAAAKSGQSVAVIQELLNRGADPATRQDITVHRNRIYADHPASTIPAIQTAALYGNTHGVRVMWDHINKNPSKYPDFTTEQIGTMAGFAHEGPTALYIVKRAHAELKPEEFAKVLDAAMSGARYGQQPHILEELLDKYGDAASASKRTFAGYGLKLRSEYSEKEQADVTRAFIRDLDRQKDLTPKELTNALRAAIDMGSAGAIRAVYKRGCDPVENGGLIKGMLRHENTSIDAVKVALEPLIARGAVKDKILLVSINDRFIGDFGLLPKGGVIGEERQQIMNYMKQVMKPLEAEGFADKTPESLNRLTERELDRIKNMKGLPPVTQLDSVPQIYDQLMERLKPVTQLAGVGPKEPVVAPWVRPELALAPSFA